MKNSLITTRRKQLLVFTFLMIFTSVSIFAQDADFGQIDSTLNDWKDQIKTIARTFMGIAAIVGAVWVFFKMQNDDGGSGRKALMSYLGALMFAALVWVIIEAML